MTEPADDTTLWRYIDFSGYLSLLENHALFFTRLTHLHDPFEGHLPRRAVQKLQSLAPGLSQEQVADRLKTIQHNVQFFRNARGLFCTSSWHANQAESVAMWRLYGRDQKGIALQTTFADFKGSFPPDGPAVHAGMVQYVDYDTHEVDVGMSFNWVILKRKGFEHEREFRAVIMDPAAAGPGTYVSVDIDRLVNRVYIAPSSPDWFLHLVKKVTSRYGFEKEIVRSVLGDHPMYYGQPGGQE